MTDNTEALRCADALDKSVLSVCAEGAAHIRRLVAENEALREANNSFATAAILSDDKMIVSRADYTELVGALRFIVSELEHTPCTHKYEQQCTVCCSLDAARAALAEPVQPVAWLIEYEGDEREVRFVAGTRGIRQTPLYTAPPQRESSSSETMTRKPLSDREVGAIMERLNAHGTRLWEFARAIECAHGIAEKSQTVTNEQLIEHVRQFMAFYGLEEKT